MDKTPKYSQSILVGKLYKQLELQSLWYSLKFLGSAHTAM